MYSLEFGNKSNDSVAGTLMAMRINQHQAWKIENLKVVESKKSVKTIINSSK